MSTLAELLATDDFRRDAYDGRVQRFDNWMQTTFEPGIAELPPLEQAQARQSAKQYFSKAVPEPQSDYSGDLGTAFGAGVDVAQAIGGEVVAQANELTADAAANPRAGAVGRLNEMAIGGTNAIPEDVRALSAAKSARRRTDLIGFVGKQTAEAEAERADFSEWAKDKQYELQQIQAAATSDGQRAAATIGFYLSNPGALGLLATESAPATLATVGATVAGGVVAGPAGAGVMAVAAEGAMGAGEASLGAFEEAKKALLEQGLSEDAANLKAREVSRKAALIGGVGSAALGKLGEALPVINAFNRRGKAERVTVQRDGGVTEFVIGGEQKSKRQKAAGAAKTFLTAVSAEGAQGGLVQVAQNVAVDEVTPTGMFDDVLTAAATEALAGAPTTIATQAGSAAVGAALPTYSAEEAQDLADEIMAAGGIRPGGDALGDTNDTEDTTSGDETQEDQPDPDIAEEGEPTIPDEEPDLTEEPDEGPEPDVIEEDDPDAITTDPSPAGDVEPDVTGGDSGAGGGVPDAPETGTDGAEEQGDTGVTPPSGEGTPTTPDPVPLPDEPSGAGQPGATGTTQTPGTAGDARGDGESVQPDGEPNGTTDGGAGTQTPGGSRDSDQPSPDSEEPGLTPEIPEPEEDPVIDGDDLVTEPTPEEDEVISGDDLVTEPTPEPEPEPEPETTAEPKPEPEHEPEYVRPPAPKRNSRPRLEPEDLPERSAKWLRMVRQHKTSFLKKYGLDGTAKPKGITNDELAIAKTSKNASQFYERLAAEYDGRLAPADEVLELYMESGLMDRVSYAIATRVLAKLKSSEIPMYMALDRVKRHKRTPQAVQGFSYSRATIGRSDGLPDPENHAGILLSVVHPKTNEGTATSQRKEFTETLVHELLHAATTEFRFERRANTNNPYAQEMQRLYKLTMQRVHEMTAEERAEFSSFSSAGNPIGNMVNDPDELLAWGLTNKDFQDFLKTIKDPKGSNVWNSFTDLLRKWMKIPKRHETVLSSLLKAFDNNMPTALPDASASAQAAPDIFAEAWDDFAPDGFGYNYIAEYPVLRATWQQAVDEERPTQALARQLVLIAKQNRIKQRRSGDSVAANMAPGPQPELVETMRPGPAAIEVKLPDVEKAPMAVDGKAEGLPALPVEGVDTTVGLDGAAGAINAAVQGLSSRAKDGKLFERGSYVIADPDKGVAYVMTKDGVPVKTIPFAAAGLQSDVHTLRGEDGVDIKYRRVRVTKPGARRKPSEKVPGVVDYHGMSMPESMVDAVSPPNRVFSGTVYIIEPKPDTQAEAEPPQPTYDPSKDATDDGSDSADMAINQYRAPLPDSIQNALSKRYPYPQERTKAVDIIDLVLAHPDIQDRPFYKDLAEKLRPHLDGVEIVQNANLPVPGRYTYNSMVRGPKVSARNPDIIELRPGSEGMSYHVMLHEMAHAATVAVLSGDKGRRSARTDAAVKELERAFNIMRSVPALQQEYGLTNIFEFVAEVYSNSDFRDKLDAVTGNKKADTMFDRVRNAITNGLFRLTPELSSDTLVDWSVMLFETSRDLAYGHRMEMGTTGRTYQDRINGHFHQDAYNAGSYSAMVRAAFRKRMKLRTVLLDDMTPYLEFLNLKTRLGRVTKEFDSYKGWMILKAAPQVKKHILGVFNRYHDRKIKQGAKALYQKYKANGFSAGEMLSQAGLYATIAHIPNATRVVRNRHLDAIADVQAELKQVEQDGMASGLTLVDVQNTVEWAELKAKEARLLGELQFFDMVQANSGRDPSTDEFVAKKMSWSIQGGATAPDAKQLLAEQVTRIAQNTGIPEAEVQADMENMRTLFVEAHRAVYQQLVDAGEVSWEELQAHKDSGLYDDFIPFTGIEKDGSEEMDVNPYGGGHSGSLSAPMEQYRKGRLSPPEDAYTSLQRKLDNMGSRISTRKFKHQLLADLQSGGIDASDGGWVKLDGRARQYRKSAPKGIKPIFLRRGDSTYEMWLTDPKVMDALRNISGEAWNNKAVRGIGQTTRAMAMTYTFLDVMFAPLNWTRDTVERAINIGARDISWTDSSGNKQKVDVLRLQAEVAMNSGSPALFADTLRLFRAREFSKDPSRDESTLVRSPLGKMLLEAEANGAIGVEFDSVMGMFHASISDKKAQAAVNKMMGEIGAAYADSYKTGKKMSASQIRAQSKRMAAAAGVPLHAVLAGFRFYNRVFDVRASVAVYAALRAQNVPADLASFRTLDLMNYNQRGTHTSYLRAINPFFAPIMNGGANLLRTAGTARGAVMFGSMLTAATGLVLLGRLMAGEDDEDPSFVHNRYDTVSKLTKRGSMPVFLNDEYYVKLPVPYGLARMAWVSANQTVDAMTGSVLDDQSSGITEVLKAGLDEIVPLANQIDPTESVNHLMAFSLLAITPEMMRGFVGSTLNMSEWGNTIDAAISNDVPGHAKGYFRTPEFWKEQAKDYFDASGGKVTSTPQSIRNAMTQLVPGVAAGWWKGQTLGDRDAKGLPTTATQDLGYFNVFGLAKIFGKATPMEETTAYALANRFNKEKTPEHGSVRMVRDKLKILKSGLPSKAQRKPKKKWVWNDAALADAGKSFLPLQEQVVTKYEKARRKINTALNLKYNEAVLAEQHARNMTGDEDHAFAVSMERLNQDRDFYHQKHLELRVLHRQFILDMRELEKL